MATQPTNSQASRGEIRVAVARLLVSLGIDLNDSDFVDTDRRVTDYLLEHFPDKDEDPPRSTTFPTDYHGIVSLVDLEVDSICPHHLLPVKYTISLAYIPKGQAIGLSKLARLAQWAGKRAVLQENLTSWLANILQTALETEDVAVVISGCHSCMSIRGVMQDHHRTITSEVRGAFEKDAKTREEWMELRR